MGSAGTAVRGGCEAILLNPGAAISRHSGEFNFGTCHPFGMNLITASCLTVLIKSSFGCFGGAWINLGSTLYQDQSFILSFSKGITSTISVGCAVELKHESIKTIMAHKHTFFDMGFLLKISKGIKIGGSAIHLSTPYKNAQKNTAPVLRSGVSFTTNKTSLFCLDIVKPGLLPWEIHAGCEFKIFPVLLLRLGFIHDPAYITAGLGFNTRQFQFRYALTNHPVLCTTHSVSCNCYLK